MLDISSSSMGQKESELLDSINTHLEDKKVDRIYKETGKLLGNKLILDSHRESIENSLKELSDNGLSSIIWLINRLKDEIDERQSIIDAKVKEEEELAKEFPKQSVPNGNTATHLIFDEGVPVSFIKGIGGAMDKTIGNKFDSDKPRHTLIDPYFEQSLMDVLEYGAKKYGVNNWQSLDDFEDRYLNAIYRHLNEIRKGNLEDSESGLPHISHVAASVMFLYWFNHVKVDDNKT